MSGLSAFLEKNQEEIKHIKFPASRLYKDENGKPMEWEIRQLKSKELDCIRKECSIIKKGGQVDVDTRKFNAMVTSRCTVFPNLNDKELQDSYGVMGAESLITELLCIAGEYNNYVNTIMKFSGMDKSDEDLVNEAKN